MSKLTDTNYGFTTLELVIVVFAIIAFIMIAISFI